MNWLAPIASAVLLLLLGSGCASLRETVFDFDAPSSVVARAREYIQHGNAREEGNFRPQDLETACIDYSHDSTTVEVSFYIIPTFKTSPDGRFTCKLLDIEMDRTGKFISASTADRSQGGPSLSTGF
jgi:hypothetical protein